MSRPVFMGAWRDPKTDPPRRGIEVLCIAKLATCDDIFIGYRIKEDDPHYAFSGFIDADPLSEDRIIAWAPLPVYREDGATEDDLSEVLDMAEAWAQENLSGRWQNGAAEKAAGSLDRLRASLEDEHA